VQSLLDPLKLAVTVPDLSQDSPPTKGGPDILKLEIAPFPWCSLPCLYCRLKLWLSQRTVLPAFNHLFEFVRKRACESAELPEYAAYRN